MVKNLPANTGDFGSIPGLGSSPGEGNDNPLQYSGLGNPIDRGPWWATVRGGHKKSQLGDQTMTIPSIAGVSKSHSILNLQFFSLCFLIGRVWSWQFSTPLSKLNSLHGQPGEGLNFWGRPLKYSCFSSGYKHHCSLQPLEYLHPCGCWQGAIHLYSLSPLELAPTFSPLGPSETKMSACVLSHFSHAWFFATLWTSVGQSPLSLGILQARILGWFRPFSPGN